MKQATKNTMNVISAIGYSILCFITITCSQNLQAQIKTEQVDSSWKQTYRAVATKTNNLKHTKLVASFNYEKSQMNGEVWLKLQPHFYPTKNLGVAGDGGFIVTNNKIFFETTPKSK